MRISVFLRNVFPLLALASPALLLAQFQQPTDEELKMTADPKAPGAAAVYLYHEENTDQLMHVYSLYERIKVLTEKGKELATIQIPYEHGVASVTKVEGRTIHADGSIIPLTAKPDDLMDYKTKHLQENTLYFNLPSVEVGSILEYRVKLTYNGSYSLPTWWIQQPYFVHKAHYYFRPGSLDYLLYAWRIPTRSMVVENSNGEFSLDIIDIPPLPNEDWMPPINTFRWRVDFYYTQFLSRKDFWVEEGKYWGTDVREFISPSLIQNQIAIRRAAADLVAISDSDEQKARKIYAAVQKIDNTDFSREKSREERKKDKLKDIFKAEDVWKQQSGSANEIALLYVSIARAAGLQAWPAKVVDRSRALFDRDYLSISQLDDFIAVLELDGKKIYLDPGQKMCPFGSLHWKHTLASGFLLSKKDTMLVTTPPIDFEQAFVQRIGTLNIEAQGNVKGSIRFVMNGPTALYWRQLALENDEVEVKKQFNDFVREQIPEGVQADSDHFLALDDSSSNLVAVVNISGSIAAATGKRFFLPGLFFESRGKHPFVALDKRTIPIDVHYPEFEQDEVTYHPPPGFSVESLPQDASASWPEHAVLKIHYSAADGAVTVQRALAYNFTLLDPKDYPSLHDFYLKVATADQQQLVLTHAPAAKGN